MDVTNSREECCFLRVALLMSALSVSRCQESGLGSAMGLPADPLCLSPSCSSSSHVSTEAQNPIGWEQYRKFALLAMGSPDVSEHPCK